MSSPLRVCHALAVLVALVLAGCGPDALLTEEGGDAPGSSEGAATAAQQFKVSISKSNGSVYDITCFAQLLDAQHGRYYGSDTLTQTTAEQWACGTAASCSANQFQLRFARVDPTNALGGRCQTADTVTLSGANDYTLSANLFLHTNVAGSDGVFTIALMPEVWVDNTTELDLVVINLRQGQVPWVKFGKPGHAMQLDLSRMARVQNNTAGYFGWVNVEMRKRGSACTVTVARADGVRFSLGPAECTPSTGKNHLVINSRAQDTLNTASSFIDVKDVKWVQN